MAKLIQTSGIVPAWIQAIEFLASQHEHKAENLLLEIQTPCTLFPNELNTLTKFDEALAESKSGAQPLSTVANTIFPQGLYNQFKRPGLYSEYQKNFRFAKEKGAWGSYFKRMIEGKDQKGNPIIPIDVIIKKLAQNAKKTPYNSAYELGIAQKSDLSEPLATFCDIPTYDCSRDRNRSRGGPCLSHLSFKLENRKFVNLVVLYRAHYYIERALGNLIGLSQLLKFVASEAGLETGTLTCLSTHAVLDVDAIGGMSRLNEFRKYLHPEGLSKE